MDAFYIDINMYQSEYDEDFGYYYWLCYYPKCHELIEINDWNWK